VRVLWEATLPLRTLTGCHRWADPKEADERLPTADLDGGAYVRRRAAV
jgi:hypothetical protein